MIKASDLRVCDTRKPASTNLLSFIETRIKEAHERGMRLVNVEVPEKAPVMELKKALKKQGFGVMSYKESGILASNLIVPARTFVKVFW